jgi:hypothetical protein
MFQHIFNFNVEIIIYSNKNPYLITFSTLILGTKVFQSIFITHWSFKSVINGGLSRNSMNTQYTYKTETQLNHNQVGVKLRVKLKVVLRPTVSRSVCLGIKKARSLLLSDNCRILVCDSQGMHRKYVVIHVFGYLSLPRYRWRICWSGSAYTASSRVTGPLF